MRSTLSRSRRRRMDFVVPSVSPRGRRCVSVYRHPDHHPSPPQDAIYKNETLLWASKHRALAQECLEIPTTYPTSPCPVPFTSLEDYLTWRQWPIPLDSNEENHNNNNNNDNVDRGDTTTFYSHHAKSLVSHVLSAPLTAASQLFSTFSLRHWKPYKPMHWCCIGARSEASLPVAYWKEMLVLWAHYYDTSSNSFTGGTTSSSTTTKLGRRQIPSVSKLQLTLDFVGPDILRRPSVSLSYQGHELTLRWLYNGTFHELLSRMKDHPPSSLADDMLIVDENTWDAYILFNPGLGHDNLRHQWEPTLQLLLSAQSTVGLTGNTARIVLTAHSARDAQRDTDCLTQYLLPEAPLYHENVFASRIDYEDPLEKGHIVRPNHYAYTLVWQ